MANANRCLGNSITLRVEAPSSFSATITSGMLVAAAEAIASRVADDELNAS